MSHAVIAWGRFNPPTEEGHGKLVKAVQDRAEKVGGQHYIFPTHTQDKKKNPMTHADKVGAMRSLFPNANVVSHGKVKTIIDAMKHLEKKGHSQVTVVAGSDRVPEYHKLLNTYREKEFPGIKKVHVVSAGHRDPDAEGAEGMSASKLRGLVSAGKKKEFVSHYSDPKLGAHIHDRVKAGMQMESVTPVGIFLLGGPGSGKDYVLKNIFSRFDLTEVQADQILNGAASELYEGKKNIVINGALDESKISIIQNILEGYDFDHVYVSVTNKVSRVRNGLREQPLAENKRIEKFLAAEKLAEKYDCFNFNNSINLNESSDLEKVFFASQIEKLLERVVSLGLEIKESAEPKAFMLIREKTFPPVKHDKESGLPKKYVAGLGKSTAKARAAHWKEKSKLSDSDPRAYEPAPGDATAKTKPSKYTKKFHAMYGEASSPAQQAAIAISMKKAGKKPKNEEVELDEGAADTSLAGKAKKSGISVGTLRKVYNRGVAAWNSGHRPGTTPQQWGHARVNSYITKGKTYHTADKDLHEEEQIDEGITADMRDYFAGNEKPKSAPPSKLLAMKSFFKDLENKTAVHKAKASGKVYHVHQAEETEPPTQKPHLTVDQIAKKHKVDVAEIEKQLKMGQKIEHEHTKDMDVATDIALNHLGEFPDYYTRLTKLEKQAKAGLKEQEESEVVKHERKVEQQRRIRDTRVLTHQNRHVHQAAMGEAIRRVPRSGNITAVVKKRELNDAERAGFERAKIMNNTPKVQEETIEKGASDTNDPHVTEFASRAHDVWRKGFDPEGKGKERIKKNSDGTEGNINVPFNKLHPDWQKENLAAGRAAKEAVKKHGDNTEAAAEHIHNEWMKRNPKQDYNAAQHVPYSDLPEPEKEKDRVHVRTMRNILNASLEEDINTLFEMQLVGTDEYRKHAIAMTPGQGEPVDAFPVKSPNKKPVAVVAKKGKSIVSQYTAEHTNCGTPDCCGECSTNESSGDGVESGVRKSFGAFRASIKEAEGVVDTTPVLDPKNPKHKKSSVSAGNEYHAPLQGFTAAARHTVEEVSLEEAVQYHLDNNISITENVFRPGSDMFFQLIGEAKRLYVEGKYTPVDEYEQDLLNSDIGEKAMYEGKEVILDFPIVEEINEDDETGGHGIGKPFRSGGGGAVYVKNAKGNVIKVNFSQSGMKKRYNEPGRVRSFVARHHCLTNKDRTSASYWACRWPRYFSNTGQQWW